MAAEKAAVSGTGGSEAPRRSAASNAARWSLDDAVLGIGLVALYLIVTALLPDSLRPELATDLTVYYLPVSERFADGHGITTAAGQVADLHAPGMVILLAGEQLLARLLGASMDSMLAATGAVAFAATGVVLHRLHAVRFGRRAATAGLIAFLIYPLTWWTFLASNVEVAFTPLVASIALICSSVLRARSATRAQLVGLGLLLGVTTLIRPNAILLAAPIVYVLSRCQPDVDTGSAPATRYRHIATRAILVVGTALIVITPWVTWASVASERLVPVASSAPATMQAGLEVGSGRDEESGSSWIPDGARRFARAAADNPGATTGEVIGNTLSEAIDDPTGAAQMLLSKATRSWYGTESLERDNLLLITQVLFGTSTFVGWWTIRRTDSDYATFIAGVLLTGWVTAVATLSIVRFLSPFLIVAVWLAPLGIRSISGGHSRAWLARSVVRPIQSQDG